jgi:hypothetical protein
VKKNKCIGEETDLDAHPSLSSSFLPADADNKKDIRDFKKNNETKYLGRKSRRKGARKSGACVYRRQLPGTTLQIRREMERNLARKAGETSPKKGMPLKALRRSAYEKEMECANYWRCE